MPTLHVRLEEGDYVTTEPERGYLLGGVLIAMLLALMIAPLAVSPTFPPRAERGFATVLMGVYVIAWGLMFLASYYFSHKTFFFRALMWVCEHWSSPRGRRMAFFYFALATFVGVMAILTGLGMLEGRHR